MKIAFIGCVEFSYHTLQHLLIKCHAEISCVVTRKNYTFNSDFRDLSGLAEEHGVPCFFAEGNDQDKISDFIKFHQVDVIFCFGWSYLLGPDILKISRLGVVGYHPAALPANRGRHPLIWALALDLSETASTFFWMDEGADSGPILHQEKLLISEVDDAQSVYNKIMQSSTKQIDYFYPRMQSGLIDKIEQDQAKANYWRKRSRVDGQIDFRMTSKSIYNLVRALTKPYVGAHVVTSSGDQKVWKVVVRDDIKQSNLEPGKVLKVKDRHVLVKTQDSAIELIEHEMSPLPIEGGYL